MKCHVRPRTEICHNFGSHSWRIIARTCGLREKAHPSFLWFCCWCCFYSAIIIISGYLENVDTDLIWFVAATFEFSNSFFFSSPSSSEALDWETPTLNARTDHYGFPSLFSNQPWLWNSFDFFPSHSSLFGVANQKSHFGFLKMNFRIHSCLNSLCLGQTRKVLRLFTKAIPSIYPFKSVSSSVSGSRTW